MSERFHSILLTNNNNMFVTVEDKYIYLITSTSLSTKFFETNYHGKRYLNKDFHRC